MVRHYSIIFEIFILIIFSGKTFALYSLKSTASSGYYRDSDNKDHATIFFDFKHHYLHKSGVESFIDLGINNNFEQDKWDLYPHQFNVNIPLDNGLKNAPYYKSRVILGRQLLTEGFELDLLDGVVLPYYFSSNFGVTTYFGALHVSEQQQIIMTDQIYGASILLKKWESVMKVGPTIKSREGRELYLGHLSIMKDYSEIFLAPIFFVKTQFDLEKLKHDQSLAETQLYFKQFQGLLSYSSVHPDGHLQPERRFIYSLVAIDKQRTVSSAINWDNEDNLSLGYKVDLVSYTSLKGEESGTVQELSGNWRLKQQKISPFLSMISSFGGTMYQGGVDYTYQVDDFKDIRLEADMARCEKINGIEAWLYHTRAGMNYNLGEKWRALLSLEVERNHLFDLNLKAVAYVTHFQY